jgi:hypothetical protein
LLHVLREALQNIRWGAQNSFLVCCVYPCSKCLRTAALCWVHDAPQLAHALLALELRHAVGECPCLPLLVTLHSSICSAPGFPVVLLELHLLSRRNVLL